MYALQPELRARRPVAEFVADMADQLDGRGRDPPHPVPRIGRHQPLDAPAPPALPPPPNRPGTDSIVPASGRWPVLPCISQHQQAIPHPRPILLPHLHIAELDHWPPLARTVWSGCPSKQRRSILSRYFTGRWRGCSGGGEGLANDLLELGEVERLAQDGQARLREEAMQLGGSDAPRHEDDPRHGVALPFGQRAIEADAIELRHVEIAEDQVEVGVPDLLEGGHAVLRAVNIVAFHVERVYDESNDEGIIVDDEDSSRDTRRGNGRLISGHWCMSRPVGGARDRPALLGRQIRHLPCIGDRGHLQIVSAYAETRRSMQC